MKSKWHITGEGIWLIPIGILVYYYVWATIALIPIICLAIWCGALIPDADMKIILKMKIDLKKLMELKEDRSLHRWAPFHSIIAPVILWVLSYEFPILLLLMGFVTLGIGIHLLQDIHFRRYKMKGTYCIKFWKWYNPIKLKWNVVGLNGRWSTAWLLGQFWLSVLIFVVTLMRVI